jgi:predicted transglutaminase-like cysteine proteinase
MVTRGPAKVCVPKGFGTPVAAHSSPIGSSAGSESAFKTMTLCATICLSLGAFAQDQAHASFSGMPNTLKSSVQHIQLGTPALAPMADTEFCIRYPGECEVRQAAFRGGAVGLTAGNWDELTTVNTRVNEAITPKPSANGRAIEKWTLSPKAGDCNDYVVTKRHELIALGWPAATLLLAEVVTDWGEHHLVLVIRTRKEDFVLDNLTANIRPWSDTPYRWVRIQSPQNPNWWSTIRSLSS